MSGTFQRNIEDFTCEHCGVFVSGNGYTNHCPQCLWSKHVDVYPGDRASQCGGMMEPIEVLTDRSNTYTLLHKCVVCGYIKKNKISRADNMDAVIELARKRAHE